MTAKAFLKFRNIARINRIEDDWLTPVDYLPYIDALLGDIDLDPCTTEKANKEFLRARNFYTKEEDGLNIDTSWTGKVYLFAPTYGRCSWSAKRGTWKWGLRGGSQGYSPTTAWYRRLTKEWKLGNVSEALMFSTNHETLRSIPELWDHPICIPYKRANLVHGGKFYTLSSPLTWGFFVYFPPKNMEFDPTERFREIFSNIGNVIY